MYKALNYWIYGGYTGVKTPYEFIDFAVSQQIDGVEMTVGGCIKPEIPESECRAIAAYAAEKNVGLRTIATDFYWRCSLTSEDAAERSAAMEFSRKYLQIANWLDVETVLFIPGAAKVPWDPSQKAVSYAKVWDFSKSAIEQLIPLAEDLDVNLALENVWNRFLFSPMEWKHYLEQFSSPKVGMYFDVANCCIYLPPQDYIEILGSRIKAIHIKNFTGSDCAGGLHDFGDDLLEGDVDFSVLREVLKKTGYHGPLTAEMVPFSRMPDMVLPDEALAAETCQKLKTIFN